nr:unnamed protein product [Callosobruchus chinensis]
MEPYFDCIINFTSAVLDFHFDLIYASSMLLVCKRCNRSYSRKDTYGRHIRNECGREKDKKCPICQYASYRSTNLKTHMASKHKSWYSTYSD